ncbi:MAG: hypothetical protein QOG59_2027, partial [Solirubrobacteraceae bacterium]|nr:hypothetical protein [Solirubrobacteraceae bacterium]
MGEQTLLVRYCEVYGLNGDTAVAEEQVHQHFELETALSRELMQSPPEDRWGTFERCYNRLYSELPWLVGTGGVAKAALWTPLLGAPGASVYEIGSGAGELATALAEAGYRVTATDVSAERGDRVARPNLTWASTDGVH